MQIRIGCMWEEEDSLEVTAEEGPPGPPGRRLFVEATEGSGQHHAAIYLDESGARLLRTALDRWIEARSPGEASILRELLRRMVSHLEEEGRNGDGIHESAWEDYQAARMWLEPPYGDRPPADWDPVAASRGALSILQALRRAEAAPSTLDPSPADPALPSGWDPDSAEEALGSLEEAGPSRE